MYIRTGNEIIHTPSDDVESIKKIPKGNWLLKFNEVTGKYYLEGVADFKMPDKLYGDVDTMANRYLSTYDNTHNNLGVLLTGVKGTGKTILGKLTAMKSGLPVVMISECFIGEEFKSFLMNIKHRCIIFIDEFEKVFNEVESQNTLLSVLDGTFESNKLFIFTSNNKNSINRNMLNRPGRIHYLKEYDTLSNDVIDEVIVENLNDTKHEEGLIEILNVLGTVTMDMLFSLISEMNMYKETAKESVIHLNLKPEDREYLTKVYQSGNYIGSEDIYRHPLNSDKIFIEMYSKTPELFKYESVESLDEMTVPVKANMGGNGDYISFTLHVNECKVIKERNKITFIAPNKVKVVFTPKSEVNYLF